MSSPKSPQYIQIQQLLAAGYSYDSPEVQAFASSAGTVNTAPSQSAATARRAQWDQDRRQSIPQPEFVMNAAGVKVRNPSYRGGA